MSPVLARQVVQQPTWSELLLAFVDIILVVNCALVSFTSCTCTHTQLCGVRGYYCCANLAQLFHLQPAHAVLLAALPWQQMQIVRAWLPAVEMCLVLRHQHEVELHVFRHHHWLW